MHSQVLVVSWEAIIGRHVAIASASCPQISGCQLPSLLAGRIWRDIDEREVLEGLESDCAPPDDRCSKNLVTVRLDWLTLESESFYPCGWTNLQTGPSIRQSCFVPVPVLRNDSTRNLARPSAPLLLRSAGIVENLSRKFCPLLTTSTQRYKIEHALWHRVWPLLACYC